MNYKKYSYTFLLAIMTIIPATLFASEKEKFPKKTETLYKNLKIGGVIAAISFVTYFSWYRWHHADDLAYKRDLENRLKKPYILDGLTPFLMEAAYKGYTESLKLILNKQANVNNKNKDGKTPLYMAVKGGHIAAIKLLIKAGGDVLAITHMEETLLEAAFAIKDQKKKKEIMQCLFDNKLQSKENNKVLHYAIKDKEDDIVKVLIKNGVNVNQCYPGGWSPIATALALYHQAQHEHSKNKISNIIKLLLQTKQCDINTFTSNGFSPLYLAVEYGLNDDIIKLLIANGANVNARTQVLNLPPQQNTYPLFCACQKKRPELIKILLDAKADPYISIENEFGTCFTPYEVASALDDSESLKLLPKCTALKLRTEEFKREQSRNTNVKWFMRHPHGDTTFPPVFLLSKIKKNCTLIAPQESMPYGRITNSDIKQKQKMSSLQIQAL